MTKPQLPGAVFFLAAFVWLTGVGKVVAVGESVTVPFGSFTGCVKTEDRNPLETGAVEYKFYCPGVGTTLEHPVATPSDRTELVDVTGP